MERYIGLDVHAQSCTLAVVSGAGKRLGLQVVETNGAALKQTFSALPGNLHVCLEEGTQSAWIYELLKDRVDVAVIVPEPHYGPKDDARDAWALAESLRVGAIKRRVYKDCGPFSELRAAVRSYRTLWEDVGRTKNRLKAIYRSRGLLPRAGAPSTRIAISRGLGSSHRSRPAQPRCYARRPGASSTPLHRAAHPPCFHDA